MSAPLKSACSWVLAAITIAVCICLFYNDSLWVLFTSLDTGWIVQTGQYILDHGVPTHDIFSWTNPQRKFVAYQWLFELVAGALFRIGSLWLVGFVGCITAGFLILFLLPRIWLAKGMPLFVPFLFLCFVETPHWFNFRPQMCSYLFILAYIAIMERYRLNGGTRWLWSLPLLMVLWANLHSFWFIGLLIVLTYLVCEAARKRRLPLQLSLLLAACCAAVFINPYGAGLVSYIISFVDGSQYMKIWELLPSFESLGAILSVIYLPLGWLVFITLRSKVPAEGFMMFGIATAAAVMMRRFESVSVLTSWIYAGQALAAVPWSKYSQPWRSKRWTTAVHLLIALIVAILTWYCRFPTIMSAWMVYTEDTWPLLAIVSKHTEPGQRVFNDPQIGSWLISMGAAPVFVDTRIDMYPKGFMSDLQGCLDGKDDWQERLNKWGVSAVIARDDCVLNRMLLASPDWLLALDDGTLGWWLPNTAQSLDNLRQWRLSDDTISSEDLPKWIFDSTVHTRCAKYLVLARLHLMEHDPQRALEAARSGLKLMPQSQDLKTETELCSRLLRSHINL